MRASALQGKDLNGILKLETSAACVNWEMPIADCLMEETNGISYHRREPHTTRYEWNISVGDEARSGALPPPVPAAIRSSPILPLHACLSVLSGFQVLLSCLSVSKRHVLELWICWILPTFYFHFFNLHFQHSLTICPRFTLSSISWWSKKKLSAIFSYTTMQSFSGVHSVSWCFFFLYQCHAQAALIHPLPRHSYLYQVHPPASRLSQSLSCFTISQSLICYRVTFLFFFFCLSLNRNLQVSLSLFRMSLRCISVFHQRLCAMAGSCLPIFPMCCCFLSF